MGVGTVLSLPKLEGRGPTGHCSRGPGGLGVPASPPLRSEELEKLLKVPLLPGHL